ncbi:MAG: tRNA (adenosine(37)-N6)-threonylcarbamoyltransferase complex dimerization subunit type 1 TsaB [Acidimicrobiales bacterium]
MNLLAIETATAACAIGVRAGEAEVNRVLDEERHHTEALAPGIEALLGELGLRPRDLDRVVVDRGPGLYTGLRVGLATADALARALGCDRVAVTSLELLALGALATGARGRLLAVVDARRGEVFVQRFELDGVAAAGSRPVVVRPEEVAARLATGGVAVTLTGDGAARYAELFADLSDVTIDPQRVPPTAAALALGATRPAATAVRALYLREADAVANFVTRERS